MSLNSVENISLREELISTAVKFLSSPNILKSPLEQKQKFLRSKGLTDDEINKAFELGGTRVGGLPAVASSELLMYRHSKQSWFKEVFLSLAAFGGIAYGIYWIYKKWIETLLFGARPKKKTVDERLSDLSKSLETSMTELKQEIVTVRSEVDRLSNLQSNNNLTRGQIDGLKSDIASVKGILLNRNQFPSLSIRAEPPSIPAWQLQSSAHLQAEGRTGPSDLDEAVGGVEDKQIAGRGGDVLRTGRGERSESGGSNSSEGDAVTKNSDSSLEIIA